MHCQFNRFAKKLLFSLLCCVMIMSSGCASKSEEISEEKEVIAIEPVYAPLTGLEVSEEINNPAVSVKIANASDGARPQVNLNKADIVYEELVEGNITRYIAIYNSVLPDIVGPVRSARPTDASVISPYSGAFVYSGLNSAFANTIYSMSVCRVDEGSDYLVRDISWKKYAPNNLFASVGDIASYAALQGYSAPSINWTFDYGTGSSAYLSGSELDTIYVAVGSDAKRSWVYNSSKQVYERFYLNGDADYSLEGDDYESSAQETIWADNLIVLKVDMGAYYDLGEKGYSPNYLLDGYSGSGYYLNKGYMVEISWSKSSSQSQVEYSLSDGNDIVFASGRTWVLLVPNQSGNISFDK